MYIAMNRFKICPGKENEFENVLNIVCREIEQGDALSEEVINDLKKLINSDIASLEDFATLIKEQKIDLEDQDLQNILVKLSKNKIDIVTTYTLSLIHISEPTRPY